MYIQFIIYLGNTLNLDALAAICHSKLMRDLAL